MACDNMSRGCSRCGIIHTRGKKALQPQARNKATRKVLDKGNTTWYTTEKAEKGEGQATKERTLWLSGRSVRTWYEKRNG